MACLLRFDAEQIPVTSKQPRMLPSDCRVKLGRSTRRMTHPTHHDLKRTAIHVLADTFGQEKIRIDRTDTGCT